MRRLLVLALVAVATLWSTPASAGTTPTATSFRGIPTVAPLFRAGTSAPHECTTSVIASRHHNLVLTAAHCVFGAVAGWQVAPGYRNGKTPYGVWTVAAAYVPRQWASDQDPQHDYAILRIKKQRRHGRLVAIQDVTGANRLALAPRAGERITDVAYNAGTNDRPITCTVPVYYTHHYPSFNCHGYVGGSSGSPWLHRHTVVGVIGGLHQGGCTEHTSYSSRFRAGVFALLRRANHGGAGDTAPIPGGDGC